ncbi:PREDICTED: protein PHLOEM PROTEIN 2-LIKE A10-like [Ipomoea nil]|uniref:protein PHLOEM PROTEIN 2-LIKE A10-like n=1 Tax=Ipomoea nil TaxID=35883 RepID=UPI000901F72A|nr:PREDICTED: protein PHLOEM PROTEIN 2-LIKE A10-like [Ipomoea nil]XP_019175400.1 PREDICTED: protein PHLOEM PROTEIN 2-LIKE A10-like [Ipomoea nil]
MDFEFVKKGLILTPKKKKWLIALGVIGASSYGAYRVYNIPSIVRKRRRIMKVLWALVSVGEMVCESAEAVTVVSKDLKEFLQSDSNEIPSSFKQLSKVARSEEFSKALSRVSEAVTSGVLKGHHKSAGDVGSSDFSDKLMDRLTSSAGAGFASVVVGSFAKNLVMGFYSNSQSREDMDGNHCPGNHPNSSTPPGWVDAVFGDRSKVLMADCIQTFVGTAIAVYLDKTMHINFYDEMFSGMTNPKHQAEVRDIMVSLCNGAVETLVKTSHRVLTSNPDPSLSLASSVSIVDHSDDDPTQMNGKDFKNASPEKSQPIDLQSNGWLSSVSSTLAVPSNRKFVLDVTGRVTFETVRSIVEFLVWKMSQSLKTSVNVVQEEVSERGMDVIRYICAKSSVILTICLALLLHILGSTHNLLPAQI